MNCKKVEMVLDSKCFCGDKFIINPDVEIQVDLTELTAPIGLFGHFKKLTLNEKNRGKDTEVWAQDLAEKTVVNITSKVELKLESITIQGSAAREICKPFNEYDVSEPGMVIKFYIQ